ncbi:MAG: MaoC family dehydratase [Chloroflexota bacterium]
MMQEQIVTETVEHTDKIMPGQRFSKEMTLTTESVKTFAEAAGDLNPVHHDADYAATTRYKRIIASGTQTSSLMMGLTATYFSQHGSTVGLGFEMRFRLPIYADETIFIEWEIISVTPKERLGGNIVSIAGTLKNEAGAIAVEATASLLVT